MDKDVTVAIVAGAAGIAVALINRIPERPRTNPDSARTGGDPTNPGKSSRKQILGVTALILVSVALGFGAASFIKHGPPPNPSNEPHPGPSPIIARATAPFPIDFVPQHVDGGSGDPPAGWEQYDSSTLSPVVQKDDDGTFLTGRGQGNGVYIIRREIPRLLIYTTSDTDVVWRFKGRVDRGNANKTVAVAIINTDGADNPNTRGVWFGLTANAGNPLRPYLQCGSQTQVFGEEIAFNHWYDVDLHVDFGVMGATGSLYVRQRDGGSKAPVQSLQNLPLGLIRSDDGQYRVAEVMVRIDDADPANCKIRDFSLDSIRNVTQK